MKIESIGKFLSMDNDGFIINDLRIENIQPIWNEPIAIIVQQYHEYYNEKLHSIYLRGSVSRGLAVSYVSDIDTFALIYSDDFIRWKSINKQEQIEQVIQSKFPFVSGIEMNIASFEQNFYLKNPRLAMVIQTQSLSIYGNDISNDLPKFRPTDLCLNTKWFVNDLNDFKKKIENQTITLEDCKGVMKIIIRVGFELIVEREQQFTPDLYLCYQTFSKYYPTKEKEMRQALEYFLNPICDLQILDVFVNQFGNWLERQINCSTN